MNSEKTVSDALDYIATTLYEINTKHRAIEIIVINLITMLIRENTTTSKEVINNVLIPLQNFVRKDPDNESLRDVLSNVERLFSEAGIGLQEKSIPTVQ